MTKSPLVSRRTVLRGAGTLALAAGAVEAFGPLTAIPARAAVQPFVTPSDVQFDIAAVSASPQTSDTGVRFAMPPVHTMFLTARLSRTPTVADQTEMKRVLSVLESNYLWSAAQQIGRAHV